MKFLNLLFLFILAACSSSLVYAETVYFLVAEISPSRNDSYVLPLEDPCDIAHARKLIEEGPGGPNTMATIAAAYIARWDPNDGININRDYLQPGIPAWSWYVVEFLDFGELASVDCDGWPTAVEDGLDNWIQPGYWGQICFWAYTVVAELGTDLEPWNCDLDISGTVDMNDLAEIASHWLDVGCCHRYYCEGTDIDVSGEVDFKDFAIFANHWLWGE